MHGCSSHLQPNIEGEKNEEKCNSEVRPPPYVVLMGDTTIATIRKAIAARRRLLSKTNYKNIILEILYTDEGRLIWKVLEFSRSCLELFFFLG